MKLPKIHSIRVVNPPKVHWKVMFKQQLFAPVSHIGSFNRGFYSTSENEPEEKVYYLNEEDLESNLELETKWIPEPEESKLRKQLETQCAVSRVKSSGPGGQHVNKTNTKIELRFHVPSCGFMNERQKKRFMRTYAGKMNKETEECIIMNQETRNQHRNQQLAYEKLIRMILEVWQDPKLRKLRKGRTKKGDEERLLLKKKRAANKEGRKNFKNHNFSEF